MASSLKGLVCGLLGLWVVAADPARAEWLRAESPNFIVFSQSSESRVRQQLLELEEFDRLLRLLTATSEPPSPNKLNIYFVRGGTALRTVLLVGPNVAGFYSATPNAIVAAVDETRNRGDDDNDVLFHEYAHHFMMQYRASAYPPWYVEGFAEYVSTVRFRGDGIEIGRYNPRRAVWAAESSSWIPYERILFERLEPHDAETGARYYAQSWFLVHYLLRDDERRRALTNYLTQTARGADPRQAFAAAFGTDTRSLERSLRAYMDDMTYSRIRRFNGEPPQIRIERLPASADDLLLLGAAMNLGLSATRQDEVLAQVRRLAARHNDGLSQRVLALAEIMYGDPATGERLLEPLLTAAPNDASLLFLRGMRHLHAGRKFPDQQREQFRLARQWFARAHRADPNHFPTLFNYAESYSTERDFVSENTENILLLAAQLAPQVSSIRLSAARMLMMRSKFDEAEALLLPLASSPHESGDAAAARQMLSAARQRRQPAEEPPEREEPAAAE